MPLTSLLGTPSSYGGNLIWGFPPVIVPAPPAAPSTGPIPQTHIGDLWTATEDIVASKVRRDVYRRTYTGVLFHLQPMRTEDALRAGLDMPEVYVKAYFNPDMDLIPASAVIVARNYLDGAGAGAWVYYSALGQGNLHTDFSGEVHHQRVLFQVLNDPPGVVREAY